MTDSKFPYPNLAKTSGKESLGALGRVAGNFQDFFKNLSFSRIFGKNVKSYPVNDVISPAVWDIVESNWNKDLGYAFRVEEESKNNGGIQSTFNDLVGSQFFGQSGFQEFILQVNPSDLTQDEEFAVVIRPTQTGVVTEHKGFIFKDLIISGTTAVHPLRGEAGIQDNGTLMGSSGRSGFLEFLELRNYFRAYAQYKTDQGHSNARMIFENFKDNESWYIEPLKFSMKRNSSRATLYDYNIVLKIIGKAKFGSGSSSNSVLDFLDEVDNVLNVANEAITGFTGMVNRFSSLLKQSERALEETILGPINRISTAIYSLQNLKTTVLNIPRQFIQATLFSVYRLRDNTLDLFGENDPYYDSYVGRDQTVDPKFENQTTIFTKTQIMEHFNNLEGAFNQLISSNLPFSKTTSQINSQIYRQGFGNQLSFPDPSSVKELTIKGGDTLESISAKVLGDPDRWVELVTLNNLIPPYLSDTPSSDPRIKSVSDKILIPLFDSNSPVRTNFNSKNFNFTRNLSELDKFLGIDLRLNLDSHDLMITNSNDYSLVSGSENAAQALFIKLGLEKGSLKRYPEIGLGLQVGTKSRTRMAASFRTEIARSVLTDPRFVDIKDVYFEMIGGQVKFNLTPVIADMNLSVPLKLSVEN